MRFKVAITPSDLPNLPEHMREEIMRQLPRETEKQYNQIQRVREQIERADAALAEWRYVQSQMPVQAPQPTIEPRHLRRHK